MTRQEREAGDMTGKGVQLEKHGTGQERYFEKGGDGIRKGKCQES